MTMRFPVLLASVAAMSAVAAQGASAQLRYSAVAQAASVRLATERADRDDRLTGTGFGFAGSVGVWRVGLELEYLEGRLNPAAGSAADARDWVEGSLALAVRPAAWLVLSAGPQARSYLGIERWVTWRGAARIEMPLVGDEVRGFMSGWGALGGDVNVLAGFGGSRGMEAGMLISPRRLPIIARAAYRAERSTLGAGSGRETVETLILGVGIGRL